jgi:predicted PP-loop superfamily ATPase
MIFPKHFKHTGLKFKLMWLKDRMRRKARIKLREFLCRMFGHKDIYQDHYWSGGFETCGRCHSRLKTLWLPTVVKKEKDELVT